jgi:hypothetical protein
MLRKEGQRQVRGRWLPGGQCPLKQGTWASSDKPHSSAGPQFTPLQRRWHVAASAPASNILVCLQNSTFVRPLMCAQFCISLFLVKTLNTLSTAPTGLGFKMPGLQSVSSVAKGVPNIVSLLPTPRGRAVISLHLGSVL